MRIESGGSYSRMFKNTRRTVAIYIAWLDDASKSISEQLPTWIACPNCSHVVGLVPVKADRRMSDVSVVNTSLACDNCGSTIIIDKTPTERRANLPWLLRMRGR